jgi:hypothetical protein
MMAAGGSVDANIQRWEAQFKNAEKPKAETVKVGDLEVRVIELSGTFLERAGGPVTPATERPDYRLLGAIIPLTESSFYFLKLTGPSKTVLENQDAVRRAIESLQPGK